MKAIKICFFALMIFCLGSCSWEPNNSSYPAWLYTKILALENDSTYSCVGSIWRYEYEGEYVFYFSSKCADGMTYLYNYEGSIIGSAGGFTGIQTGVILNFWGKKENGVKIWPDED